MTAPRSYSRLLALEAARILFRLGCDVRVYDPTGLPVKDDVQHPHSKVQELRNLSRWSDGHVWVSPEQHGNVVSLRFLVREPPMARVTTFADIDTLDRGLQESNRLDSSLDWLGPTHTRTDSSNCSSFWRFSVLQHRQHVANPRTVDAHVHHTEPKLNTESLHAIYG